MREDANYGSNVPPTKPTLWPSDATLELVVLPWSGWELKAR